MSRVSRRVMDKDIESYTFGAFINSLVQLKEQADVKNFIEDLLSPSEKIMLAKRVAIAILLESGYSWSQIDQTLKVSRPTIMTVSYFLKNSQNNGYRRVVEKFLSDQKREAFFDKIEEILLQ